MERVWPGLASDFPRMPDEDTTGGFRIGERVKRISGPRRHIHGTVRWFYPHRWGDGSTHIQVLWDNGRISSPNFKQLVRTESGA